jgi:hypothetical protein
MIASRDARNASQHGNGCKREIGHNSLPNLGYNSSRGSNDIRHSRLKADQNIETVRIGSAVAFDKARKLEGRLRHRFWLEASVRAINS